MQPGVAGVENHLVVAPELAPGADVAEGARRPHRVRRRYGKQVIISMNARKALSKVHVAGALACALGVGGAAIGTTSAGPATPALAAYSTSTESVIAANWTAFFNPKTPVAKRISLLQDGQQF